MNRILHFSSLWLPVVAYGGAVYYVSSLSRVGMAGAVPDYLSHPLEYAGFTVLIIRALNGGLLRPIPGTLHCRAVALALLYAISDEIHQLHVPRRNASLKDVLSDTLGAVLAVGLVEVIQRTRARRRRAPLPVILYTRERCHLCQDAREILARLAAEAPLAVSEIDVDSDPELTARFGEQVPVIVVEGAKVSKLVPREAAIRRRLFRRLSASPR